jgi:O-methyltransferase involved in polyketide biosynthesis
MREGRASWTAEQNALFRALESSRPPHQRVCDDPLVRHFLSWPFTMVMGIAAIPGISPFVCSYIDRRWPGVRSSVVARTRLIDDLIATALDGLGAFVLGHAIDGREM